MEGFRRWDSMLPALPGGTCSPIIINLSVYVLFTNVSLKRAEILHSADLAFLDRQGRSRWKLHGGTGLLVLRPLLWAFWGGRSQFDLRVSTARGQCCQMCALST